MKKKWIYFWAVVSVCTALLAGCTNGTTETTEQNVKCELEFLETGKSDCILIQLGDTVILNDTADEDDYQDISNMLKDDEITTINYLILSHFDKDHIGSAAAIIQNYDVDTVIMPSYWEGSVPYQNLIAALQTSDTEQVSMQAGAKDYIIEIASGEQVAVSGPKESSYKDENNYSLITTVQYQETSFLLTGDALKDRCEEFMGQIDLQNTHYQLIKMPHHGDYNKKLKQLIESSKPAYAVITSDFDNSTVEDKLLTTLSDNQCEVLYTNEGNIHVTSDGKQITVQQE